MCCLIQPSVVARPCDASAALISIAMAVFGVVGVVRVVARSYCSSLVKNMSARRRLSRGT